MGGRVKTLREGKEIGIGKGRGGEDDVWMKKSE